MRSQSKTKFDCNMHITLTYFIVQINFYCSNNFRIASRKLKLRVLEAVAYQCPNFWHELAEELWFISLLSIISKYKLVLELQCLVCTFFECKQRGTEIPINIPYLKTYKYYNGRFGWVPHCQSIKDIFDER